MDVMVLEFYHNIILGSMSKTFVYIVIIMINLKRCLFILGSLYGILNLKHTLFGMKWFER